MDLKFYSYEPHAKMQNVLIQYMQEKNYDGFKFKMVI